MNSSEQEEGDPMLSPESLAHVRETESPEQRIERLEDTVQRLEAYIREVRSSANDSIAGLEQGMAEERERIDNRLAWILGLNTETADKVRDGIDGARRRASLAEREAEEALERAREACSKVDDLERDVGGLEEQVAARRRQV